MTNNFDASDSIERGFEMKVRDMTSTDTQIRPIRQGTVAAYLGEMITMLTSFRSMWDWHVMLGVFFGWDLNAGQRWRRVFRIKWMYR